MYLSRVIRKTLINGIVEQLDMVKHEIEIYRNPKIPTDSKFDINFINSEIDDIEESLRTMKTEYYFNGLDRYESKLNQLKETVQMTVSSEVI